MPFYCVKRFAGICVVLGPKKFSTYSSEYASGFSSLRPRICQHLLCLATKDYSNRLLARVPSWRLRLGSIDPVFFRQI